VAALDTCRPVTSDRCKQFSMQMTASSSPLILSPWH